MKDRIPGLTALILTLAGLPAGAQTATSSVRQQRAQTTTPVSAAGNSDPP